MTARGKLAVALFALGCVACEAAGVWLVVTG